jgi:hypothetical protein
VGALVRKEQPVVFTEVGLHTDVEITLDWDKGGDLPLIYLGDEARMTLTFADVDTLERLAAVAAEGARQFQERMASAPGAA